MSKISPKARKHKHQSISKDRGDDYKQEMVAQVHRNIPKSDTSSERTNLSFSDDNIETNNRTYKVEDQNDNYSIHNTPSREISVDGETQINSKILSLIETEMKRDINKHSHFTDSRPQSLSFYEDEKIPEELSGNLELLSPEERKHYKRRKEHQLETEERNAYNVIQDLYSNRDNEEILGSSSSTKKSKSRKKRHSDIELGIGDSREMMIPKEKRKSKKKKRESSPMSSSTSKRKHKKREDEFEPKNDITAALDDLQDDVFENNLDSLGVKHERVRKSPRQSDKIYVQRKNKFEVTSRPNNALLNRQSAYDFEEDSRSTKEITHPLEVAIPVQKIWMKVSFFCHAMLGGLAMTQWLYVILNLYQEDFDFFFHYTMFGRFYFYSFYVLCVMSIISCLDRLDLAHIRISEAAYLVKKRRLPTLLTFLYCFGLIFHLTLANLDERLYYLSYPIDYPHTYNSSYMFDVYNVTSSDIHYWNHFCFLRSIVVFVAWLFVAFWAMEENFYNHLKSMEKYIPIETR